MCASLLWHEVDEEKLWFNMKRNSTRHENSNMIRSVKICNLVENWGATDLFNM